jgi:hypothetical protein
MSPLRQMLNGAYSLARNRDIEESRSLPGIPLRPFPHVAGPVAEAAAILAAFPLRMLADRRIGRRLFEA